METSAAFSMESSPSEFSEFILDKFRYFRVLFPHFHLTGHMSHQHADGRMPILQIRLLFQTMKSI